MEKNLLAYSKKTVGGLVLRDNAAVRKLPAWRQREVEAAIERHNARALAKGVPELPGLRARLEDRLESIVYAPIKAIIIKHYRCASSAWAGGDTYIHISRSHAPSAAGEARKCWSKNGKWSGSDAFLRVSISPSWRWSVASIPGLADAGGMLTTHARECSPGVWRASWVRQSRGFDLRSESGYIVRCPDGTFAHARTEKAANQVCKRREAFLRREAKAAKLRGLSASEIVSQFGGIEIIRRDSLRAGNCETGTDSWIAKHMPGRSSATVKEILAVDVSEYALAAVKAGILRAAR